MRRLLRARIGGDEGMAMVMVIGVTTVLSLLAVAGIAYAVGTMRKARNDQDWSGALTAAYAGVEEYQSRLANDPAYLTFGNPAAPFTTASGSTVYLPETRGGSVNPAFSLTGWATVPGSGGAASFRYEVDNSDYYSGGGGTIRLRSTGRVGEEVRSVVAELRQVGFIDFLYFTDFETQDPDITQKTTDSLAECAVYEYSPTGRSSDCTIIQFGRFDTINGPLHTNDTMYICGATFNGQTTSTYNPATGLRYKKPSGCSYNPVFTVNGIQPAWSGKMPMPETNTELRRETRSDLPVEVPNPGCLYTGPTSITLDASGKMRVRSPWTKATSASGGNNVGCGTPGGSGLGSATGQLVDVPNGTVVYVQNVPAVATDPNYWGASEAGRPTCATNGNSLGYPTTGEALRYTDAYGCRNGDIFIEGTLDGQVTIAAENYIYVTGDVRYEDDDDDVLGLVGQNAVWVRNPVRIVDQRTNRDSSQASSLQSSGYECIQTSSGPARYTCTDYALVSTTANRRIDAAILSVAHTFMVQNYDQGGSRGTLTVNGAIAQRFRGTVATSSGSSVATGYAKDYNYDTRFENITPPKFLSPAVVTYAVKSWAETSPAFNADGTVR